MRTNIPRADFNRQYPESEGAQGMYLDDIEAGTLVIDITDQHRYFLVGIAYDFHSNGDKRVLIALDSGVIYNGGPGLTARADARYIPVFSQCAVGEAMPQRNDVKAREIMDIENALAKAEARVTRLQQRLTEVKGGDGNA